MSIFDDHIQTEHLIQTPDNWGALTLRQKLGYLLVRFLSKLTQLVWLYVIREPVWRSASGVCTPISKLETEHLRNIVRMLDRKGEAARPLTHLLIQELIQRPCPKRSRFKYPRSERSRRCDPDGQ